MSPEEFVTLHPDWIVKINYQMMREAPSGWTSLPGPGKMEVRKHLSVLSTQSWRNEYLDAGDFDLEKSLDDIHQILKAEKEKL